MLCDERKLLNDELVNLEVYASKEISRRAKSDPTIIGLSFGEPEFGPPEYLLDSIKHNDLSIDSFLDSVKRYETPKGSIELRTAITTWYKNRYGLSIDPEHEIMITHGGVEAIVLAILSVSKKGDGIAISDPSYMLYDRALHTLGRAPIPIARPYETHEYTCFFEEGRLDHAKALIVNSPENPSGYMLDESEWEQLYDYALKTGLWVIHDEVYDTMAFDRVHKPYRTDHSVIVNSCSKKFGMPGLRIGWLIANKEVIDLASKIHDYLYLGVNILSEKIALTALSDSKNDSWFEECTSIIKQRAERTMSALGPEHGFTWSRRPFGAMFLFPRVDELYKRLPSVYKQEALSVGNAVANYLLEEKKIAVVPGSVYGKASSNHIRIAICRSDEELDLAIKRLSST